LGSTTTAPPPETPVDKGKCKASTGKDVPNKGEHQENDFSNQMYLGNLI